MEIYGGVRDGIGMKTLLHGPMDFTKKPWNCDLAEVTWTYQKEGRGNTSSREEEEVHAQMYPCGKPLESRTHILGECEMHEEERDVLEEETRKSDECDTDEFGSEKTIA